MEFICTLFSNFRIKDNLARHKNDLHAMLLESVDYMANTDSDIGRNSAILEGGGMENKSLASGSRKSSSVIGSTRYVDIYFLKKYFFLFRCFFFPMFYCTFISFQVQNNNFTVFKKKLFFPLKIFLYVVLF